MSTQVICQNGCFFLERITTNTPSNLFDKWMLGFFEDLQKRVALIRLSYEIDPLFSKETFLDNIMDQIGQIHYEWQSNLPVILLYIKAKGTNQYAIRADLRKSVKAIETIMERHPGSTEEDLRLFIDRECAEEKTEWLNGYDGLFNIVIATINNPPSKIRMIYDADLGSDWVHIDETSQ